MHRSLRWTVALTMLTGAWLGACGGDDGGEEACGPPRQEELDTRSLQHVVPGGPEPSYPTDPPTSGPHQPAPPVSGSLDQPLTPPVQVGLLEQGKVLVQYRGLGSADVERLQALAGDEVVVAPAATLPNPFLVMATAWTYKQSCTAVDIDRLEAFIADRRGKGPERPGTHA